MREARLALVVFSVLATACGGTAAAPMVRGPSPSPSPSPGTIAAIVDQAYPQSFGVQVAVYRNAALVYENGFGLRDRGLPDVFLGQNFWNIEQPDQVFHLKRGAFAPDGGTSFDLASVSKEFTAAAILLLQQDGKLSVNDPVAKYFPSLPSANSMTLLDLLHHTSGLVDYNNFGSPPDFYPAYTQFLANGQNDYQPIVDTLATVPLLFAPGTQYSYSNTNYLLLGMIVARVSGEPLGAFLQQRIFGPLGMAHTAQGYPPPPVTDLALGYRVDGVMHRSWQPNLMWLAGPGGLTSTVSDLEKWDEAVRTPGIFSASTLAQMFAPCAFPQPYGTYAAGWFISTLQGQRYIWHDGALAGYQTMNATFPDIGLDIIILTNDGSGLDPFFIIPQILQLETSSAGKGR